MWRPTHTKDTTHGYSLGLALVGHSAVEGRKLRIVVRRLPVEGRGTRDMLEGHIWDMFEACGDMFGTCLGHVWNVSGTFAGHVWTCFGRTWNMLEMY